MQTLNEVKWRFLSEQLGATGSLSNLEYRWLVRETMRTGHTTPQLWFSYLRGRGYSGSVPQMLMKFLGDLGYEGSLSERLYDWYKDYSLASALSLLGNEPNGTVFDFQNNACVIKDQTTPANNFYGTIDEAIAANIISFTRATNAGRFNSSGLFETVSSGIWRRQYDPVTLLPLGYLPEPQRTNLARRSEEFGTSWSASGVTVGSDAAVAPDGASTAESLLETSATGAAHGVQQFITCANATAYTFSVYLKANGRDWANISIPSAIFTATARVWVNLATGAIGTSSGSPTGVSVVPAGNGWYRLTVTKTSTAAAGGNFFIGTATSDGGTTHDGDTNLGIYVWGAQLEAGAYPTSYIPTTSATVTRNADVMTVALSKLPWLATEGTLVAVGQPCADTAFAHTAWDMNDTTNQERIVVANSSAGTRRLWHRIVDGGSTTVDGTSATDSASSRWKDAFAYKLNDAEPVVNGVSVYVDATTTIATPTRLSIGANYADGVHWAAPIESLVYIPRRLSQAEMIARTAA